MIRILPLTLHLNFNHKTFYEHTHRDMLRCFFAVRVREGERCVPDDDDDDDDYDDDDNDNDDDNDDDDDDDDDEDYDDEDTSEFIADLDRRTVCIYLLLK